MPSVASSLLNFRTGENGVAKQSDSAVNPRTLAIDFVKDVVKLAQEASKSSPQTFKDNL